VAPVGWGVLGAGAIAATFAADLELLPDEARLVAVGSRTAGKAEAFAKQHGFTRAYGSYAELVADPEVDVVYVATVHNHHAESARLCLEAGKAVLVEKPLTLTAAEAEELVALARTRRLFAMEAMWTRTNPLIRRAAELVASGELGPVRHLSASFGSRFTGRPSHRLLDPGQAGGAIWDLGVYPVHLAQLLVGEPDTIGAQGSFGPTGVDTHAAALLGYPPAADRPAATAALTCSLEADLPNRLEVACANGTLTAEDLYRPSELTVQRRCGEPEVLVTQWPGHGYTFQAQEVMRCLRTGELESPLVPWADTLAVMRTLDRWRASLSEGGR